MAQIVNKPNFFIAGAAKAGTTTLWDYLKHHPEVFMPVDELHKEPGFFSDLVVREKNLESYLALFAGASRHHKLIGEASTAYLTDPSSARNIFDFNPDARIIIILRNPADRAYSLYNWMVQDGYEYLPTFEKALAMEESRIGKKIPNYWEPEYYYNYQYFHSGLYSEQLKRYLDLFRTNVLVLDFEELVKDAANCYAKVCSFLRVAVYKEIPKVSNPSYRVYHPQLQFRLRKWTDYLVRNDLLKFSTKDERDKWMRVGFTRKKVPPLRKETRAELVNQYRNDVNQTSRLLKWNLEKWLVS